MQIEEIEKPHKRFVRSIECGRDEDGPNSTERRAEWLWGALSGYHLSSFAKEE